MNEKQIFLKSSNEVLSTLYDKFTNLEPIRISQFDCKKTALIIVDMVNGFVKEGPMSSKRVLSINDDIAEFSKKCSEVGIKKVAFADCHTDNSPEFSSYPVHCLKGDFESQITDEIKSSGEYLLIEKNSTNGFIEPEFSSWLDNNKDIENFIIVGDCTDICVQQFSLSLKTYFNMINSNSRIVVVKDLVETYDLDTHYAELMNIMSLYNMSLNGIEIVSNVEF